MSAIKVGDLVVVARSCCIRASALGSIFSVAAIGMNTTMCRYCKTEYRETHAAEVTNFIAGVPLSWLRRIPPLSELRYADRFEEERI